MVVRTVPGSVVREASKNGGMGNQHSLKVGSTDLKTLFPEVAAEADGWDPSAVAAQSNKRMPWVCTKGHRWETSAMEVRSLAELKARSGVETDLF